MDLVDQVPILVLDVLEADVSQDTSVVEENINAAECLDGRLNDSLAVLNGVVVGDGLAARGLDLVDYYISGLARSATSRTPSASSYLTFVELPSPLNEPPRSLTTTFAPRDPKNVA